LTVVGRGYAGKGGDKLNLVLVGVRRGGIEAAQSVSSDGRKK